MENREQLIQSILEIEWSMFQKVKSATPASCQSNPEAFRKVRASIFDPWPLEVLSAYLDNLKSAREMGRNLLTEKYARMDNIIPPVTAHPMIDTIVAIESKWQKEMQDTYPALYNRVCRSSNEADDGSNFSVYLRCELETYGTETIQRYHEWVQDGARTNRNYSIESLEALVRKGGFKSLAQAEDYFTKTNQCM